MEVGDLPSTPQMSASVRTGHWGCVCYVHGRNASAWVMMSREVDQKQTAGTLTSVLMRSSGDTSLTVPKSWLLVHVVLAFK